MVLPEVRGRIRRNVPMAELSWLRVGGPAEVLFQPADAADLAAFLAALDPEVPVLPIGVCSNLLIRDGGLRGVVIRLGRGFNGIEVLPGHRIRAGAAALDAHVAKRAAAAGIDGLAFLRTIPGALGGAVRMNAGCYGSYLADVFAGATAIDRQGRMHEIAPGEIAFTYRDGALPEGWILTEVTLQGRPGDPAEIEARMEEALAKRAATQPVDQRSCGSTFRNPAGFSSTGRADDTHDLKAWKLIEEAGCRGLTRGGAQISPMHANFLVNTGGATATDIESLGEEVRERVWKRTGIRLEWEIKRLGREASERGTP
ncbi:MAG: UDP-N-acetylmuramate dehydrogenase [Pseudomonadota bacterium]